MKSNAITKNLWSVLSPLVFFFMLISCQKVEFPDPSTLPKGLTGSWVEINTLSDTIIFNSNKDTGMLILHRGYEIRNGYRLPIIGSDGYQYILLSDSIRLRGGLSAVFFDKTFLFRYDETNLTIKIGKFSEYINTKKSTLTFRKIK